MAKEIIIDGVNVSKCEHLQYKGCDMEQCLIKMASFDLKCEGYNCHYKQTKRAEQKLQAKEQECEELKKGVIKQCPNCGEQYLNHIGAKLYEENEALKKQLEQQEALTETYKTCYRAKHNDVKDELIRLKQEVKELKEWQEANQPTGICETCTAKSVEYADKCRIALVEIEYVTKELFLGVENKDRPYCEKILNIINKAKEK